jgi:predicted peptidase
MKRLLLPFFILVYACTAAQDTSMYLRKEFATAAGNKLLYRVLYPENFDKTKSYPLVLFLHGAGERGNDNNKQLIHGAKLFLADSNRKNFPAIVVFPQCPSENFWAVLERDTTTSPPSRKFDYTKPANWPLTASIDLVKHLVKEGGVDSKRIYVAGLSMGGMGTFEAVSRNPDLFAAALPICGGGDSAAYKKANASFWIFHGDADPVVNVRLSRTMVATLKSLNVNTRYTEYPGVNHNSWDSAFKEPDFISWMFSKKLK